VADTTDPSPVSVSLVPPRVRAGALVFLPKLYYSTETKLGVGGDLLLPFTLSRAESSVRLRGRVTATGKSEARVTLTIGTGERGYALKTMLRYSSIPIRFYGIGPDTKAESEEIYEPQALDGYVEVLRRVVPHLELGARFEVQQHRLIRTDPNGQLETGDIRGTSGRVIAGAGLVFEHDTRDRRYSPSDGWYSQGFLLFFDDELGSERDFNNYHLDVRRYDRVGSVVFASQLFWFSVRGLPPFWRYAALGGRAHTRGYRKARYLDRELLSGQIEVRHRVWRRLGWVVFGGLAGVAPRVDRLRLDAARPTFGGGLRFAVGKKKGLNAAFDVAFGTPVDAPRFYLGLDEAF
jgi:hypothetical protein